MALLAAFVDKDGTVGNGAGVTGAVNLLTGQYEVDFNRDVSNCLYSANGFAHTIILDLEPKSGNPDGVFLGEVDTSGTFVDDPFYRPFSAPAESTRRKSFVEPPSGRVAWEQAAVTSAARLRAADASSAACDSGG